VARFDSTQSPGGIILQYKLSLVAFIVVIMASNVAPTVAAGADEQKAVLITGATSGIGRNAAERLAKAGYFVYAGARKDADMDELNKIDNVMAVRIDVTKQEQVDAAVALIEKEGRGLWGLVNNAGVNVVAPLIDADVTELEFLFDVNVFGVFRVTKAFAPLIMASNGRIVNISSISGVLSGGGYGMYAGSKHAVEAFTDALEQELEPFGVFVAAVNPGNFASEIGLTRCQRRLANPDEKPWPHFEDRYQEMLASCRERIKAGVAGEGVPPDAVGAAIEQALFDENPRHRYLVVPEQEEAGWTIAAAMEELLRLDVGHEYSYTRDELVELIDAYWPFVSGDKSWSNDTDAAQMEGFMNAWMKREDRANVH
jgi:NAD(P)-dependent dehydrogenase (short-subunit alcohol dehydrogenase family)